MSEVAPAPASRFIAASDGLRLHLLDWAGPTGATPLVCLPGLARTTADFEALAACVASTRRVVALDYRGRGRSERDPDWRNYSLPVENADILSALAAVGVDRAIFCGTSRGGLHVMLLSATRPELIRAAILNDIGPVIEPAGLARIRGYIGKLPSPSSWADAVDLAKRTMSARFTGPSEDVWRIYARQTFEEKDGRWLARYDPQLAHTFDSLDIDASAPTLWPAFDGLPDVPLMVVRGENSDLLSPETLVEMKRRRPRLETINVPGEGHAPLLLDTATLSALAEFIARADAN